MSTKRKCLAVISAGLLLLSSQAALGQADYPNIKGPNQQTGHNANPITFNTGQTTLQWFVGSSLQDLLGTITVDDTVGGTNGAVTSTGVGLYAWQTPTNVNAEAQNPYTPSFSAAPYHYARCTPSAVGADASVAETPANSSTYTFSGPLANLGFSENYALYASIPIGATDVGAGSTLFPQRYFVYKIHFGTNQTITDVVDTHKSGFGFVRLGGGGAPTNAVFAYDGIHPITVTLCNTIPRDANGNLLQNSETTASQLLVYGDGFQAVPSSGFYSATPTSAYLRDVNGNPIVDPALDIDVAPQAGTSYFGRITSVLNQSNSGFVNGIYTTVPNAVVRNYIMNPHEWANPPVLGASPPVGVPQAAWTWTAAVQSSTSSVVVAQGMPTAGWTTLNTGNTFQGTSYFQAPVATTVATEQTDTFQPTLVAGSYAIYAYLPGSTPTVTYGSAIGYNILQGGVIVGTGTLDEAAGGGWVQLGTQNWDHNQDGAGALSVQLTNFSALGTDATKFAYANAVKFVTPNASYAVNSSPVHAQVNIKLANGTVVNTQVVIIADENGKIHCLDEKGNGDGTTIEYWSYPSTPNGTTQDPNLAAGIDGPSSANVPSAQMPTQFNLSTAVVKTAINGFDRLFIASTNGRIYCLDMEGRGDYTATQPGSTQRLWSYPNDYPEAQVTSTLGAFRGSLVYGDTADGLTKPTIFAPAPQGRIYSIDAAGDVPTRSTTVNWTFPVATASTLPPIQMTPSLAFGNLYFGTLTNPQSGASGTVYALKATTGAIVWDFNGLVNGATAGNNTVLEPVTDWVAGPATAPAAMLTEVGQPYTVTPLDTVWFMNNNTYVYGFNAATGQLETDNNGFGVAYHTNELGVSCTQNLSFDVIKTYDRQANLRMMPVVMIPSTSGAIYGLFANIDDVNVFTVAGTGTPFLTAYGTGVFGNSITSVALSNSRMIAGDDRGFMYVWDNDSANYGVDNAGVPPPGNIYPPDDPNNPQANAFRYPQVKLISQAAYNALRLVNASNQGSDTYVNTVTGTKYPILPTPPTNAPTAFEWGQTAYILVYNFPYQPDTNPTVNNGELVNVRISENGKTLRNFTVSASQFAPTTTQTLLGQVGGTGTPSFDLSTLGWVADGYGVLQLTIQGSGANAIPPGSGIISADITTTAVSGNPANAIAQEIAADPRFNQTPFIVDNPLAFEVFDNTNATATILPIVHNLGVTNNSYDIGAQVNGIPQTAGAVDGNTYPSQMMQSLGFGQDASTVSVLMNVFDRSEMSVLTGQGLDNVRADRSDLAWLGGSATVYNPLVPTLYPNFEDLPVNFPNSSLDYPNIGRDRVNFTMDPNGTASNPLLLGTQLRPPLGSTGTGTLAAGDAHPEARILVATPMQIQVAIPAYQPAVNLNGLPGGLGGLDVAGNLLAFQHDSIGNAEAEGYFGLVHLFVDSTGSGTLTTDDAYRQFNLTTGVQPDWKIQITTPTVDLGALAGTTGYRPLTPYSQDRLAGPFSPWNGSWNGAYQPFGVNNNGNINLLQLHLAKASTVDTGGSIVPWGFYSGSNDINAWLDGSFDLWSNFDRVFASTNPNGGGTDVIGQKPRVTDGVGNAATANPVPRFNPLLGIGTGAAALNPNLPALQSPLVGVSLPFGFPANTYVTNLRVIDDAPIRPLYPQTGGTPINGRDQIWEPLFINSSGLSTSVEPASDATLQVSFTAREARLTNTSTKYTSAAPENYIDRFTGNAANGGALPTYAPSYFSPTALRDSRGSVVTVWSTNEPLFPTSATPLTGNLNVSTDAGRKLQIYSVANSSTFSSAGISTPGTNPVTGQAAVSPLRDLDYFVNPSASLANPASTASFFSYQLPSGTYYPGSSILPAAPIDNNGTLVSDTENYDLPSFPVTGSLNPITGTDLGYEYMAFVGSGQKSTSTGRIVESHIFMTQMKDGNNGAVTMDSLAGAPWNTSYQSTPLHPQIEDTTTVKGKPTVAQTDTGAFVFYGVSSDSSSSIHFDRFIQELPSPTFAPHVDLSFGTGFESVSQPKATIRNYTGANTAGLGNNLLELAFTGKLRGRPNADVYFGRMRVNKPSNDTTHWHIVDANNIDIETANAGTPFAYFPQQTNELLTPESNGIYRAKGVEWDRTQAFTLVQYALTGATIGQPTSLFVDGTGNTDRETGMISYDTRLGGKVYVDPELGTVRFTQGIPGPNVQIRLSYVPGFLRVSSGGAAAYGEPTEMFENNFTSDYTGWQLNGGGQAAAGFGGRDARFAFMYSKSAGGNGQTQRPYLSTMRLGVRLPTRIALTSGGVPINVQVNGSTSAYQLDPANGRIYFTAADEDRNVSITYTGVDEAGNLIPGIVIPSNVSFVLENAESPVLIDQAVNETGLSVFLDPFSFQSTNAVHNERPALFWMFYTSTRAGMPDVYFQTIAPRLAPVLK